MSNRNRFRHRIRFLCYSAIIAALYTVLTYLVSALGVASGVIQLRLSEGLCILAAFTPAAIPGLTLGCLISNLVTGCLPIDILFGTLATLIGAIGGWHLRQKPYLVPLPTVLANTVIVPFVLAYAYHAEGGLAFFFLTVGIGEILSAYVLGLLLYPALKKHRSRLFE